MRYVAVCLACLVLIAAAVPAAAQPGRARQGVENGQVQSLDRILNGIRRSRPGQLSDVQGPFGPAGSPRYRIKWLTPDGHVLWITTDARTGRVLGVEGGGGSPPRNYGPAQRRNGPNTFPPQRGPPPGRAEGRGFNRGGGHDFDPRNQGRLGPGRGRFQRYDR